MNLELIRHLTVHELTDRYKGSVFGFSWAFFVPLLMLAVYTFVFGFVFKAKWVGSQTSSPLEFALFLFSGMVPYLFVADALGKAPSLITSNVHLVKKVVFPLPLLIASSVLAAMAHALIGLALLLTFSFIVTGQFHATMFLTPIIFLPLIIAVAGSSLIIASTAVFFRDLQQLIVISLPILMFISPVFYPTSAVPELLRAAMRFNPLGLVIEDIRKVVILGQGIDWFNWICALIGAIFVFKRLAQGFADVL
jgi:lipopolysaccharide transport system permease protein